MLGLQVACAPVPESALPPAVAIATHATLIELEAGFAAASRARGAKAAFLEHLGEESILLQPGPVWGRAAWTAKDDLPGTLDWLPDRAQMSADGELGFASGPWLFEPKDPKGAPVEGRYVTVWQKTRDGWRVLFDGGFGRAPAGAWEARSREPQLGMHDCERGQSLPASELQLLDLEISGIAGGDSHAVRAARRLAATAALFHPPSAEGAHDDRARHAALAALPAPLQYWPMGAEIAASGDLGYSYGLSAPEPGASADAAYVHIWCRQGAGWRLVLQLRSQLPPRAA
ncbi:MAG: nuclear transport factor 2 family protein [Steroidobacteraceae bacterium]